MSLQTEPDNQKDWCRRLYEARAAHLLLYGRALGLNPAEAEDVLHETFVALLAMETAPRQAEHYGLRSFRNRALNHRRSLWRRIARELQSSNWFAQDDDTSEAERAAMQCLATLPSEQREAIVLRIWHRRTFDEIGEITGVSVNTAAARYRYGLQKLRAILNPTDYEQLESARTAAPWLEVATTLPEA